MAVSCHFFLPTKQNHQWSYPCIVIESLPSLPLSLLSVGTTPPSSNNQLLLRFLHFYVQESQTKRLYWSQSRIQVICLSDMDGNENTFHKTFTAKEPNVFRMNLHEKDPLSTLRASSRPQWPCCNAGPCCICTHWHIGCFSILVFGG